MNKSAKYTITRTQLNYELSQMFGKNPDDLIDLFVTYKLLKKINDDTFESDVPLKQLLEEFSNSGLFSAMNHFMRKANHVSPAQHEEVNRYITDPDGNRTKQQKASDIYLLAKRLIQDLPLVPTNERIFELSQDIEIGLFDDISTTEKAYDNWDAWLERTVEILKGQGILIASKNKKNTKLAAVDFYAEAEKFINNIEKQPDAEKQLEAELNSFAEKNVEYVIALADIGLNHGLISKASYDEFYNSIGILPNYKNKASKLKMNNIKE